MYPYHPHDHQYGCTYYAPPLHCGRCVTWQALVDLLAALIVLLIFLVAIGHLLPMK